MLKICHSYYQTKILKHLDDYFNRRNIRPNVAETDRFESAVGFVHLGLGYAIIPRFYYQSFHTSNLEYKNSSKLRPKIYITTIKTQTPEQVHIIRTTMPRLFIWTLEASLT